MKVKFLKEARVDDKVAFEKGSTHKLEEASAQRWIRRGIAEQVEDGKISKAMHGLTDSLKDTANGVLDAASSVVNKEEEMEHSDGAAHQDESVAKSSPKVENGLKTKSSAKGL